jgi:hypothetical protein
LTFLWYSYYLGWLAQGINSQLLSRFLVGLVSQWYLRTRYPRWFQKYNYIIAAGRFFNTFLDSVVLIEFLQYFIALDGGTQVMVFILSFAVAGASGKAHPFPQWWGANQAGNSDRCAVIR